MAGQHDNMNPEHDNLDAVRDNMDSQEEDMDLEEEYTSETTFEFKFARDLIRYVLRDHTKGLNWVPTEMFNYYDLDSPFTPQFKWALKHMLADIEAAIHRRYDASIPDKSLVEDSHTALLQHLKDLFMADDFKVVLFLKFCAATAKFAGLSYLYEHFNAPVESCLYIYTVIRELKDLGYTDEKFWTKVQNWVEAHPCYRN